MYKLAHISDLHIHKNSDTHINIFRKLLNSISETKCNHLVITGDICDSSKSKDFNIILESLKTYDYLNTNRLSVTIGNHDIFGGAQRGDNVFLFPETCKKTDYYNKIKQFHFYFKDSFQNAVLSDKKRIFPYYKILNKDIVIIGINSISKWSADDNPTGSSGNIDNINFNSIVKILSLQEIKDSRKIILIHHHFYEPNLKAKDKIHYLWLYSERGTMKLHNKERMMELFNKFKIDLILHGHTHITNTYRIKNNDYINSSGCVAPFTQKKSFCYNIISIPADIKHKLKIKKVMVKI